MLYSHHCLLVYACVRYYGIAQFNTSPTILEVYRAVKPPLAVHITALCIQYMFRLSIQELCSICIQTTPLQRTHTAGLVTNQLERWSTSPEEVLLYSMSAELVLPYFPAQKPMCLYAKTRCFVRNHHTICVHSQAHVLVIALVHLNY